MVDMVEMGQHVDGFGLMMGPSLVSLDFSLEDTLRPDPKYSLRKEGKQAETMDNSRYSYTQKMICLLI